MLNGKTILVTGGTGSFGNAFTEYVLTHYDPKKIIIYSRDEFKQFNMANKFKKYKGKLRFFIAISRRAGCCRYNQAVGRILLCKNIIDIQVDSYHFANLCTTDYDII